jgi:hypothetical protein
MIHTILGVAACAFSVYICVLLVFIAGSYAVKLPEAVHNQKRKVHASLPPAAAPVIPICIPIIEQRAVVQPWLISKTEFLLSSGQV